MLKSVEKMNKIKGQTVNGLLTGVDNFARKLARAFSSRAYNACVFAILAAACATLGGCSGGCSKEPSGEEIISKPAEEKPQVKQYDRMTDAAYTNQLVKLMTEQKAERAKMLKLKSEYDELAKTDPGSSRLAELETALKESAKREQLHALKARMAIRDRILKEQADIRAAGGVKKGAPMKKAPAANAAAAKNARPAANAAAAQENNAKKGN